MKRFISKLIVALLMVSSVGSSAQAQLDRKQIEDAMVKAMEWQEQHPIFANAPTDWTNGAYYTGVARAHEATNNQIFMAALKNMGYQNEWKTYERKYHADDVAISYAYVYMKDKTRQGFVNLDPTADFLDKHLLEPNQWSDGSEKDGFKDILWWWCDALFMAPPVIVKYSQQKNEEKYLKAMHKYYKETYDLLYNKEEHLFARDSRYLWKGNKDDLKEENGKEIFWSRGNGWVLGGLALILSDLPKENEHYDFYLNIFKEMVAKVKSIQPDDGLWRTSLLAPESYDHGEVSGSGFFTFALAWGVNNGILEASEYLPTISKAWNALLSCQHEDGMIGWVQNIGASPEPASEDSWQNFGTGAFLLAGSEVIKFEKRFKY